MEAKDRSSSSSRTRSASSSGLSSSGGASRPSYRDDTSRNKVFRRDEARLHARAESVASKTTGRLTATDLERSTQLAFWPQASEERVLIRTEVQRTVILRWQESLSGRSLTKQL